MSEAGEFAGRRIIVTGAASGIGEALSRQLLAADATVFAVDRDEEGLGKLAADAGGSCVTHMADLSEQEAVESMVEAGVASMGGLDCLVNNAGIGSFSRAGDLDPAQWRLVHAIDLDAVFYAVRKAIPHLIESRGNIVNTASLSGLGADYGFAAYNSAKAGVIGLTRNLAVDYARDGVRVNAVCPGYIKTALTGMMTGPLEEAMIAEIPMERAGRPEEIAEAIAFLASDRASFITGEALVVDGGINARTGQPDLLRVMTRAQ